MSKTIYDVSNELCTGCGACFNSCPADAIKMEVDNEGFLFPAIDRSKCINCELCYKKCPAVNEDNNVNADAPSIYSVCAADEIRMSSSSGGVFSVLAEYFIKNGGYVSGVIWNDKWEAEYIITNKPSEINKMRGSKYVQSKTGNVYTRIKDLLENDKKVLFTGCPCQVAGLKHFLDKQYDNLLTVDIVCHGSPSQKSFDKFLKTAVKPLLPDHSENTLQNFKTYIKDISFRSKERHGWAHSLLIKMNNGAEYDKNRNETSWYNAFLNGLNCRKVCGNCRYASIPRQGDITMGDFWGINENDMEQNDGKGVSIVTVNNSNGEKIFNAVRDAFISVKSQKIEDASKKNWNLIGSSVSHKERKRFFELLDLKDDFDKITEYAIKRKFDIGYIGWWYGQNYGSVLTNFALHQYLKSRNYTVLMIEWPLKTKPNSPPPNTMSRRLGKKYYDISIRRTFNELHDLNWFCDTFVLGSDQLWNYWSIKDTNYFYFLDFVEDSKKKIAYSTSFGHPSFGAPNYYLKEASFHMSRFDQISVRENDGVDICKNIFGVDSVQTMDPVFICDKQEYHNLIEISNIQTDKPYIFAYILTPTVEKKNALQELAKEMNVDIKVVLDAQADFEKNRLIMDMDEYIYYDLEIEDWLKLLHNADYVYTDSYHGVCFSIIFEKQFTCIANVKRGLSRFVTIFELLDLMSRMIFDPYDAQKCINEKIDYSEVNKKLNAEVLKSRLWLDNALASKKYVKSSSYDLLNDRLRILEGKITELNNHNK